MILVGCGLINPLKIQAAELSCPNRYATIINPVRSRSLWRDKSLKPINNQYGAIEKDGLAATWLLQDDVLKDKELMGVIKSFDQKQEKGVFLEVSEQLAQESGVIYPAHTYWYNPGVVFLSAYQQSERRRLIDNLMKDFKANFGDYPKAAGAWWIDSYSVDYLRERYGVKAMMIVADQKTTDHYGVWGQWWGVPYYPSRANVLVPASTTKNKEDVVMVQWAQRDPKLAQGEGPKFSNYSLQANDYISQGKTTNYFKELGKIYLDCSNKVGQITVGLETGMESVGFIEEYGRQMEAIAEMKGVEAVTMSQFYEQFAKVYRQWPEAAVVGTEKEWTMDTKGRRYEGGEKLAYQAGVAFEDYWVADKSEFLNRNLITQGKQVDKNYWPVWMGLAGGMSVWLVLKKKWRGWLVGVLFGWGAFGLLLRSGYEYGWQVFYGPKVNNLEVAQIAAVGITGLLVVAGLKLIKRKDLWWLMPATFAGDAVLKALRFSVIDQKYLAGVLIGNFRLLAIGIGKGGLSFLNSHLIGYQAGALLKFDFNKIWENGVVSLFLYPVAHMVIAVGLGWILARLPKKYGVIVWGLLVVALGWLIGTAMADPRVVVPIT